MQKIILLTVVFLSVNAYSQMENKPDPDSQVNAQEQVHGLPGGSKTGAYLIRTKKKTIKLPAAITPVQNLSPANCADSLASNGGANYTACEAAKKTR